jgi:hypothetical protein
MGPATFLRRDFHVIDRRLRLRDRFAGFTHRFEVGSESLLKVSANFIPGVSNGCTPRNIRRIR